MIAGLAGASFLIVTATEIQSFLATTPLSCIDAGAGLDDAVLTARAQLSCAGSLNSAQILWLPILLAIDVIVLALATVAVTLVRPSRASRRSARLVRLGAVAVVVLLLAQFIFADAINFATAVTD